MTQLELPFSRGDKARMSAAAKAEARRLELAEWQARFARADWVAPYDCPAAREGEHVPGGWVCPDCGDIETNEFLLGNNHGWHPDQPGWKPHEAGVCTKLMLQRNHAIYAERKRVEEGRLL